MPGGTGDYEDAGDESDECESIPTASTGRQPTTEHDRFDLGTSDVDGYEGDDGNDADADQEEDASVADDETTPNVKD